MRRPENGEPGESARDSQASRTCQEPLTPDKRAQFDAICSQRLSRYASALARIGIHGDVAEDVMQDMLLIGLEKLEEFEGPDVGAWLYGIMKNLVKQVLGEKRHRKLFLSETSCELAIGDTRIWESEAEPLRWLTPSLLSLLLSPKLAEFAATALALDWDIPETAYKLNMPKHSAWARVSELKGRLLFNLGASFLGDIASAYLPCASISDEVFSGVRRVLQNDGISSDPNQDVDVTNVLWVPLNNWAERESGRPGALADADRPVSEALNDCQILAYYLFALRSPDVSAADRYLCKALGTIELMFRLLITPCAALNSDPDFEALRWKARVLFYQHIEKLRKKLNGVTRNPPRSAGPSGVLVVEDGIYVDY